jgi:hypothetical protein
MEKVSFWKKNQVLIAGLVSSITIALQQFLAEPVIDWKVVGMAVIMAVVSVLGKEWRGKPLSLIGLIGVGAYSFYTVKTTGQFSWDKFIITFVLGALAMSASSPKSIGYEYADAIKQAKKEGEIDVPTPLAPKPDPGDITTKTASTKDY